MQHIKEYEQRLLNLLDKWRREGNPIVAEIDRLMQIEQNKVAPLPVSNPDQIPLKENGWIHEDYTFVEAESLAPFINDNPSILMYIDAQYQNFGRRLYVPTPVRLEEVASTITGKRRFADSYVIWDDSGRQDISTWGAFVRKSDLILPLTK